MYALTNLLAKKVWLGICKENFFNMYFNVPQVMKERAVGRYLAKCKAGDYVYVEEKDQPQFVGQLEKM